MGLWRGDDYYGYRYDYATEYVEILKLLWQQGRASYQGQYFQLEDCLCQSRPSRQIPIVCAGQSDRGIHFTAQLGDLNFITGDIPKLAQLTRRFQQIAQEYGRHVGSYALVSVVVAETDEAAQALAARYQAGSDREAQTRDSLPVQPIPTPSAFPTAGY